MLFSVLTSSAVGLASLLIAAPAPGNALATPGSGSELGHLAARRLAGLSPNHHALARRKTNTHKKRQRCQQRPVSPNSTPAPQQTGTGQDYGVNINVGGGNDNSGGNNNDPVTTPSIPATTPPPAAYTPPPVTVGGNKLMLAWPNGDENVDKFFTGKARYYYTWSPHKVPSAPSSVEFCPMLWGYKQEGEFQQLVKRGYATCVLGMNEVNQYDQSNIEKVSDGVTLWNRLIGPLKDEGYTTFGSPSTTSAPNGLDWMKEFLASDLVVKPNVICIHWYDVGVEKFKKYVNDWYEGTGYQTIWVTEFACQNFNGGDQCSPDTIWNFIHDVVPWMEGLPWIGAYAPFGFMKDMQNVNYDNQLMDPTWGTPTGLGAYFLTGQ
jgi:hypothetical protein